MTKVLFFNSHRAWGGGEKWHFEMASQLINDGYQVTIVAGKNSELAERLNRAGLPFRVMAIGNMSFLNPFKLFLLYRLITGVSPDTIILNLPSDLKSAGVVARIAGVKRIVYRRGSAIPIRDTVLNRLLFRHIVTAVIANSKETKRTILVRNSKLIRSNKIHVIYNGIDLETYDSHHVPSQCATIKNEVILGSAGRLSTEKNQIFLIDVVFKLVESGQHCCLKIAGTGLLEADLKEYVVEKNLQPYVEFVGFQNDIASFMSEIDIFLLSSHWEGFGYVLVEAMAAKKPVVAFDSSSTPEIVLDGKTGFLVPYQNIEQFAVRVEMLANNAGLMKAFGDAGRKRVEEKFTMRRSLSELKAFLEGELDVEC